MKKIFLISILFLLSTSIVLAHEGKDFTGAEKIIKEKVQCEKLTEEQLETLGDYYMEQMHPGEAHESMEEMIGGEGSTELKKMHIGMGKLFYCGDKTAMSSNMVGMMMGNSGQNMMGGGMTMMMGSQGTAVDWIFSLIYLVIIAFIVSVIFWFTYKLIIKKEVKK